MCTYVRSSNGAHTVHRWARLQQPCWPPDPWRVEPLVWSESRRPWIWLTARCTGPLASPALLLPCSSFIHPTNSRRASRQVREARRRPRFASHPTAAGTMTDSFRDQYSFVIAPRSGHVPARQRTCQRAARGAVDCVRRARSSSAVGGSEEACARVCISWISDVGRPRCRARAWGIAADDGASIGQLQHLFAVRVRVAGEVLRRRTRLSQRPDGCATRTRGRRPAESSCRSAGLRSMLARRQFRSRRAAHGSST